MSHKNNSADGDNPIVCLCLSIRYSEILKGIAKGARNKRLIQLKTNATTGICGGTCWPKIKKMIEEYEKKKTTP